MILHDNEKNIEKMKSKLEEYI